MAGGINITALTRHHCEVEDEDLYRDQGLCRAENVSYPYCYTVYRIHRF